MKYQSGTFLIVCDKFGKEYKMPLPVHERKICKNSVIFTLMKKKKKKNNA